MGTGPTWNLASSQAFDGNYSTIFGGLSAELPLAGNRTAWARLRQTLLTRAQTAVTQRQIRVAIVQEVNNAIDVLLQSWRRIEAARWAVASTRTTYAAEQQLYERGLRTGDLVLLAAARLADAQLQEVSAIVDYQIARVNLAVATGTVLGYGRIDWAAETGGKGKQPREPELEELPLPLPNALP